MLAIHGAMGPRARAMSSAVAVPAAILSTRLRLAAWSPSSSSSSLSPFGVNAINWSTITSVTHRLPNASNAMPSGGPPRWDGPNTSRSTSRTPSAWDSSSRMREIHGPVVSTMYSHSSRASSLTSLVK